MELPVVTNKIKTIDIELAIMKEFNYRQNLIVPNITNMMGILPFETDVLVLSKNGYATGFEIKTSKADLKADFKKPQHIHVDIKKYYSKFKYFYYAVPEFLKEDALKMIPGFCGLMVLDRPSYEKQRFYLAKPPTLLFETKWNDRQIAEVARLGAMRIYSLKQIIASKSV